MLYEQRIYQCYPGRRTKLLERFETTTLSIWERYGIRQVGFWLPLVGKSNLELIYLLAWESMAEREEKWEAFRNDPEWIAKREASEADGPIVGSIENIFLEPTKFSATK